MSNDAVYLVVRATFTKQIFILLLDRNLTTVFGIITGDIMKVSSFALESLDLCNGRLFFSIGGYGIGVFNLDAYSHLA